MNQQVHNYLAKIGKRGGASGTGEAKRRGSPEYYKRMSDAGVAARKAKAAAWPTAKPAESLPDDTKDRLHLYPNDADFADYTKV